MEYLVNLGLINIVLSELVSHVLEVMKEYNSVFSLVLAFLLYLGYKNQTRILEEQNEITKQISKPRVEVLDYRFVEGDQLKGRSARGNGGLITEVSNHGDRSAVNAKINMKVGVSGTESITGIDQTAETMSESGSTVIPSHTNRINFQCSIHSSLEVNFDSGESVDIPIWIDVGKESREYKIMTGERVEITPLLRELGVKSLHFTPELSWEDSLTSEKYRCHKNMDIVVNLGLINTDSSLFPRDIDLNDKGVFGEDSSFYKLKKELVEELTIE